MALPYSRVDSSLRDLAGRAEGFGRFAVGGLHGAVYHVTSLAGTLSLSSQIRLPRSMAADYHLIARKFGGCLFELLVKEKLRILNMILWLHT